MNGKKAKNINDYIARYPMQTQRLLKKIRATIRRAAPEAEEKISYGIPAFYQGGTLVWFAGFKNHIGFFPTTAPIIAFKKELSKYETSKGTIRFPLDEPIPY
ncbi:MAG TPA: DUF1801 domain-containing protein, partial [Candidatus Bathyarchaeia archaeon]|nr:DUF1801 domain-containing protein [Candidatus Bathyarchaeia archaeon]